VKMADIRFGRVDAEQVYDKTKEDRKRKMDRLSGKKKLKHVDQIEKLKKKQEP
jgi:hypothetical protein